MPKGWSRWSLCAWCPKGSRAPDQGERIRHLINLVNIPPKKRWIRRKRKTSFSSSHPWGRPNHRQNVRRIDPASSVLREPARAGTKSINFSGASNFQRASPRRHNWNSSLKPPGCNSSRSTNGIGTSRKRTTSSRKRSKTVTRMQNRLWGSRGRSWRHSTPTSSEATPKPGWRTVSKTWPWGMLSISSQVLRTWAWIKSHGIWA